MTTGFRENTEVSAEEREAKGALLSLVTGGKSFVLITIASGDDESGSYLETELSSDMPEEIIYAALQVAKEELGVRLGVE